MKPHVLVMPPGQGRTVVCLTHLKSLSPRRNKDLKVGLHCLQPLFHPCVVETLHTNCMCFGTEGETKKKTSFELFSMTQMMKRARLCCTSDAGGLGEVL